MVSPEALKLNEILRNAPKAVDMDLPHQREADEHAEDMTSEPEGVRFEDTPAVGGLWHTPRSWDGKSVIIYLYGGGYVISSPHSRRKLASHLANAAWTRALVPMIMAWVRSRTSRENGGAAKNKEEDLVSASGQASEEASPTYTGRPTFDNGGHVHPKA